jgi:8-oxo-dGTP diphosphatase
MSVSAPPPKVTEVAAAVITRPDGSFLLGQRPPGSVYAGHWEFPGGKVERDESPRSALLRELEEELGITALRVHPWITREFQYSHAYVRLHFFRVLEWRGAIRDHIHSALAWQTANNPSVGPMLPANAPVLRALALPDFYAVTHAQEIGAGAQLARLESALERGLRLVQLREARLGQLADWATKVTSLSHRYGARVLINRDADLARTVGADGLHFKAEQLMRLDRRPDLPLVAASCHSAEELARAAGLELDFVVLGPLKPTPSHRDQPGMGWERFETLISQYALPVYAIGGLTLADRSVAWQHGAHGVAAIRAAWT